MKDLFSDDLDEENNEDTASQPLEPDSLLHDCFIYEAQNAIKERQNESEHPTNEYLPLTDDEDDENSMSKNTIRRSTKSFRIIFSNRN